MAQKKNVSKHGLDGINQIVLTRSSRFKAWPMAVTSRRASLLNDQAGCDFPCPEGFLAVASFDPD